jgi:hypothetical protein
LRGKIRPTNLLWIGLSPIQRKFPLRLRVLCEKFWRRRLCEDIFCRKNLDGREEGQREKEAAKGYEGSTTRFKIVLKHERVRNFLILKTRETPLN